MSDDRTVAIPAALYARVERALSRLGAASVDDAVVHLLRQSLRQTGTEGAFSEEEEEQVKDRLRALGYLE